MHPDPPPTREPASGPRFGPSFHPINPSPIHHHNGSETEGAFDRHNQQVMRPGTPRPNTAPNIQLQPMHGNEDATTPTTATFGTVSSALADQRPLPISPFNVAASVPETVQGLTSTLNRGNSRKSNNSAGSEDVAMDESDAGSDNGDGSRPNKKKKIQKFFCVEYPPCNLSFTRSEHLARHIRQHAQTVHVNEPIPQDSLAASGTRYPRQARSDRVRPPGQNRPRAATASGHAPTHRGHHRGSLSTSSIGTITASYIQPNNFRARPPPLQMASWGSNSPSAWGPTSPGGYETPTSATFSTGQNSPRWPPAIQSPVMGAYSRTASIYDGHRTPGRRLSTPSAANPFSSSGLTHQWGMQPNFSTPYSPGVVSSPTASTAGVGNLRRDSIASNHPDMDNRRRTWHPDSAAAFTSRLQNVMTPNHYANGPVPQPSAILPSNAPPMEPLKLPGISSFDPIRRESSPPRRAPSPMMVDRRHSYYQPSTTLTESPTYHQSRPSIVDLSSYRQPRPMHSRDRPLSSHLDRQFNHLEIQGPPQADAATWASDTARAVHATAEQSQANQPRVMFEPSTYGPRSGISSSYHQHTASAPANTPRSNRRDGWYHGPVTAYHQIHDNRVQGTSPEGSSSSEGAAPETPQNTTTTDYNPTILRSNGYPEETSRPNRPQQPIIHHYHTQSNGSEPSYTYGPPSSTQTMFRPQQILKSSEQTYSNPLDALVAVATSDHVTVQKPF
ncbi:Up in starvation [Ciborinia camelliae]|nr:Up in starvation [Ciborinia camelliae]